MRTVVGLPGTSDSRYVESLKAAGADEFFLGFVPAEWHRAYGFEVSPNRRYRRSQQVTDVGRLRELCEAAAPCPVAVTFNEHVLSRSAWRATGGFPSVGGPGPAYRVLEDSLRSGVTGAIVAGPGVAALVHREFPDLALHMSGDGGVYNAAACRFLAELGVGRVIFPRELPYPDLAASIAGASDSMREFEAFVMGEPCVYDGARCFTEHGYAFPCDFCNHHSVRHVAERGREGMRPLPSVGPGEALEAGEADALRLGRCGLCAMPALAEAGISHLKIPGRASIALPALRLVKRMLEAMEAAASADARELGLEPGSPLADDPLERVARRLLAAPRLCSEGRFCYFPKQERT